MVTFAPLVHGAAWSIAGKLVQLTLTLVSTAVIARLVGPEAYGVFALSWLVLGLFEVMVASAPMETLVQRREITPFHLNATFLTALGLALSIAGGIWLTADVLGRWLAGGPLLAAILPARAAMLPLQALAVVPTALLIRGARFKAVAGAETTASVISIGIGVALAWTEAGIWSLVGMELARAFALCCLFFSLTYWRPGLRMRKSHLADLLAFNVSTWGSWGLSFLSMQLPRFFIASSFGVQAIGLYALAERLHGQVLYVLMVPAYQAIQAGMAGAKDPDDVARRLGVATLRVTAVLACPIYLGLASVAPILVPTVFGEAWTNAVPIVQIMMLLGVLSSVTVVQAAVIRAMGKPHWEMVYYLILVATTAVLVILALPHGLAATAAAVVFSNAIALPFKARLVLILTSLSMSRQLTPLFQAGIAAGVMSGFVWLTVRLLASAMPPLVSIAVCVCVGAISYWTALKWSMPGATATVKNILLALARRDVGALRASLDGPAL